MFVRVGQQQKVILAFVALHICVVFW